MGEVKPVGSSPARGGVPRAERVAKECHPLRDGDTPPSSLGDATSPSTGGSTEAFWERPIESLSRAEWEALCDGCGKCCLHKVEDEDTGEVYNTNVACRLLDLTTARCKDYKHRRAFVPDCLRLTPRLAGTLEWLPDSCAYRLRAAGEPLPDWHYLLSGDPEAVHRAGASVVGKAVSEDLAGPLEHHIVWPYGTEDDEAENHEAE